MTRDERIRAEEARAKAAIPHATFSLGNLDPDNCRVIVDHALFICSKFPKLGARLLAVKAGSEEAMEWPEGTYAWHQDARAGSTIWFRESVWLGDNDRAAHTICHELGHAAGAQLDSTPEGRAAKTRLMGYNRKGEVIFEKQPGFGFNIQKGAVAETVRLEAVRARLRHLIRQGVPALIVDPEATPILEGFKGTYHYKQRVDGTYEIHPHKNWWSHPMDALQYVITGLFGAPPVGDEEDDDRNVVEEFRSQGSSGGR